MAPGIRDFVGRNGAAIGRNGVSIGRSAVALGRITIAIGRNGVAIGRNGVSIGRNGVAPGRIGVAPGRNGHSMPGEPRFHAGKRDLSEIGKKHSHVSQLLGGSDRREVCVPRRLIARREVRRRSPVQYQIRGIRPTAAGGWAQYNVNFGQAPSGVTTASGVESAVKIAA